MKDCKFFILRFAKIPNELRLNGKMRLTR
jgi:hypothetical protein